MWRHFAWLDFVIREFRTSIKVTKRTFTIKTLIFVWYIMWVRFILLCFLFILLFSILFSVSNRFVCNFRLLKFTLGKNGLNTVYVGDSIQQKRLPVSMEVGRTYFQRIDIHCERSKQTVNASQDWYKIPSCWNKFFQHKQIVCLRQADYMRRNSLLIKVKVWNRLFTKIE